MVERRLVLQHRIHELDYDQFLQATANEYKLLRNLHAYWAAMTHEEYRKEQEMIGVRGISQQSRLCDIAKKTFQIEREDLNISREEYEKLHQEAVAEHDHVRSEAKYKELLALLGTNPHAEIPDDVMRGARHHWMMEMMGAMLALEKFRYQLHSVYIEEKTKWDIALDRKLLFKGNPGKEKEIQAALDKIEELVEIGRKLGYRGEQHVGSPPKHGFLNSGF